MDKPKLTLHEHAYYGRNGELPESYKKRYQAWKGNKGEEPKEGLKAVDKPNSTSNKAHLKAWLDQEGIAYNADATNDELYKIAKQ